MGHGEMRRDSVPARHSSLSHCSFLILHSAFSVFLPRCPLCLCGSLSETFLARRAAKCLLIQLPDGTAGLVPEARS